MDEPNDTVDELGENWNILIQFKESEIEVLALEEALNAILPLTLRTGLPHAAVDSLIEVLDKLCHDGCEPKVALAALYNLLPSESLTESQTNDLILCFETAYRNPSSFTSGFIYWLLVAVRSGVVMKSLVKKSHYQLLFRLLTDNPQEDGLSYLLKEMTEPHHVTELSLSRLDKCYKSAPTKEKKYVALLLNYYVQIMPSIASSFNIKKLQKPPVLKITDKQLKNSLENLIKLHTDIADKSLLDSVLNKEKECRILDLDTYFGVTPVYVNPSGTKVTSLTNLGDVMKHYNSLEAPHNIISLLGSKCGQLYVFFTSPEFQTQLQEQVSAVLNSLLNNRPHPVINYQQFLKALAEAQTTWGCGMPSVTNFLTNYLILWNGVLFRDEIINLIPWLCVNHSQDLKNFMKNLFNVYVLATVDVKVKIIDAFGDLYINLWTSCEFPLQGGNLPFYSDPPLWMNDNYNFMFESMIEYFSKFVFAGLVIHKSCSTYLASILSMFYKVFLVEKKYNFCVFSLVPHIVVLLSQTSSSLTVLNLLAKLLNAYLGEKDAYANAEMSSQFDVINLIDVYCADTVNILLRGVGYSGLELARLFSDEDYAELLSTIDKMKDIMSVPKNVAFSNLVFEMSKKLQLKINKLKPENYADLLDQLAPECSTLIRTYSFSESSY